MPRKPRVQFPNAIYHIVTRGDGKQKLFRDDGHYQRFTEGLEAEVLRSEKSNGSNLNAAWLTANAPLVVGFLFC